MLTGLFGRKDLFIKLMRLGKALKTSYNLHHVIFNLIIRYYDESAYGLDDDYEDDVLTQYY